MKIFNKKIKGFTLIELMAVIVILAIILIIAIPSIGNIIQKSREDSLVSDIKMMESSARSYVTKTGEYVPKNGETEVIPLDVLVKKGYIVKIVYPDENKTTCDGAVSVKNVNGKYSFEGYLNCGLYLSSNISEVYQLLDRKVEYATKIILQEHNELLPTSNNSISLDINDDLGLTIKDPMDEVNNIVSGTVVVNNGTKIVSKKGLVQMATVSTKGTLIEINGIEYQIISNIVVKNENDNNIYAGGKMSDGTEEPPEPDIDADLTGANAPKLATGMIPVKYNESTKVWVKADVTNAAGDNQWYDYGYKKEDGSASGRWANGVMVTSSKRDLYLNAAIGTTVQMNDILQFYVWIPRYKYRIELANFHKVTPGLIDIVFEKGTEKTGTAVVNATTGFPAGEYLTHPAFCVTNNDDNGDGKRSTYLGDDCDDPDDWNLTGFWVAKFEVNKNGSSIKPNIGSAGVENINYATATYFYTTAKAFNNANNAFGFVEPKDDTHMLKSSEWGAIAYLSHSTYGRGNSAVWINNSTENLVGCVGSSTQASYYNNYYSCQYDYNNATYGGQASTTGNVYGIYDMAGGSQEYTAATKQENNPFNTAIYADINTKYVDNMGAMPGSLTLDGTIGMALYETSSGPSGNVSWYGDAVGYSDGYSTYTYPVFVRGNKALSYQYAGIFSYTVYEGYENYDITWRPSLVVTE